MPKFIMTEELRKKIKTYIKNKIDISPLIQDIDLKGEDLSGAIIKTFNRVEDDLSGCNFSRCIIGEEGKITNLSGTKFRNCNFRGTKFLGKIFLRHCDCRNSDFSEAWMPYVEGQFSDFRECKICEVFTRIGTDYWFKAKFDEGVLGDFPKMWGLEVRPKREE